MKEFKNGDANIMIIISSGLMVQIRVTVSVSRVMR